MMARAAPCLALFVVLVTACTSPMHFHASGTGGDGGTGGALTFCEPGETRECYTGPNGTKGQGVCKAGKEICDADGSTFGACEGEVLPETEQCATPADDDCDGVAPTCGGSLLWAKRFGDVQDDRLEALTTFGEDILFTGHVSGVVDFGGVMPSPVGNGDAFLVKIDGDGLPIWGLRFGDTSGDFASDQMGTAIAVDGAGEITIAGTLSGTVDYGGGALTSNGDSDVFVLRVQADGSHLWSRSFGGSAFESASAVAVDGQGNVVVVGSFLGTIDFADGAMASEGGNDVYVLKLDPGGNYLWARRYGDAGTQKALGVAVDLAGNVLVAGYFGGSVNFGGATLAAQDETDAFLLKLGPDGSHVWSKAMAGPNNQVARGVATDSNGNVLITGSFEGEMSFDGFALKGSGPRDAFVVKLDADGSALWSNHYGDANGEGAADGSAIAVNSANDVLVTGSFEGVVDFGQGPLPGVGADAFVIRLDVTGAPIWAARHGATGAQHGAAIATDGTDHVLLGGLFSNEVSFEGDKLVSAGGTDGFVAKLQP